MLIGNISQWDERVKQVNKTVPNGMPLAGRQKDRAKFPGRKRRNGMIAFCLGSYPCTPGHGLSISYGVRVSKGSMGWDK